MSTASGDEKVLGKLEWYYKGGDKTCFCNFCEQHSHRWDQFRPRRIDPNAVAKIECWFQRLVFKVFLDFLDSDDIEIHVLPLEGDNQFCRLRFWAGEDTGAIHLFGPYNLPSTTSLTDFSLELPCAFPGVSEEKMLAVASGWVQSCVSSHPECQEPITPDIQAPSRLLDLSGSHTTGLVKLVETRLLKVQYAALSYCWGDGLPLKTTKATIQKMMTSIRFIDLPITFQDAVRVCNVLGIRYLWIDSICIVQDDFDEWSSEAQKMCSIYECAYVTLAATSSESCSKGFLRPQAPNLPRSYCIPFDAVSIGNQSHQLLACWDYSMYHNADEPLHLRAWCLQEWILPRRLLSFRKLEMEYICRHGRICDCNGTTKRSKSMDWVSIFNKALQSPNDASVYQGWLKLVQDYSRRKITKNSDRIPALAGLASKFAQRLSSDTYLAGLWAGDIFRGLGFFITTLENGRSLRAPKENETSPSWSWASVRGEPIFVAQEDSDNVKCKPCDAVIQSAFWSLTPPTKSPILHQYIELFGRLLPAHLHFDDTDERSTQGMLYPFLETQTALTYDKERGTDFISDCQLKPVPIVRAMRSDWESKSQSQGSSFHSCAECSASIKPLRAGGFQEVEESYTATSYTTAARTDSSGHKFEALVYCLRILEPREQQGSKDQIEHSIVLGDMREREIVRPNFVFESGDRPHPRLGGNSRGVDSGVDLGLDRLGLVRVDPSRSGVDS
ncbi:uncharacterized protein PAC_16350 [Phialocephala subalpina]|uniref:Heterokaryon incompatibility domain-containing protein n=1 Tax=Phialocephala subalpina TaxID=576137 RepID=A0A1L7XN30_9HELO|nr:uncharacterized protein PAC_16350 [Phialocephala subalpina]